MQIGTTIQHMHAHVSQAPTSRDRVKPVLSPTPGAVHALPGSFHALTGDIAKIAKRVAGTNSGAGRAT
jgi:hypothetical protein